MAFDFIFVNSRIQTQHIEIRVVKNVTNVIKKKMVFFFIKFETRVRITRKLMD